MYGPLKDPAANGYPYADFVIQEMDGTGGHTATLAYYNYLMAFTTNTLTRGLSGLREYRTVKSVFTTLPLTPPTQLFTKPIGPFITEMGIRDSKKIPNTKRTYRDADPPEEFTITNNGSVYVMDKVFKKILRWDNPYTMYKNTGWLDWVEFIFNADFPELRNKVFKMVWFSRDNNVIMYHSGEVDSSRNGGSLKIKRHQCFRPFGHLTHWSWEKLALLGFV
jgi:hypothetical protein